MQHIRLLRDKWFTIAIIIYYVPQVLWVQNLGTAQQAGTESGFFIKFQSSFGWDCSYLKLDFPGGSLTELVGVLNAGERPQFHSTLASLWDSWIIVAWWVAGFQEKARYQRGSCTNFYYLRLSSHVVSFAVYCI